MNKKAEAVLIFAVIASLVVAGITVAGTYFLTKGDLTKGNYIGDTNTKTVYKMDCYVKIAKCNSVIFDTLAQSEALNFTYSEKCPS